MIQRIGIIAWVMAALGATLLILADVPVNIGTQTWTSKTSRAAQCANNVGQSTAYFSIVGTGGPTNAQLSNDGSHWTAATIIDAAGTTHAQPFTPTSGTLYRVTPAGSKYVQIIPDTTYGSQSSTASIRCSSSVDATGSGGGGSGGNTTIVAPTDAAGRVLVTTPGPAPTCTPFGGAAGGAAICVTYANVPTTTAPAPTVSPGLFPGVQQVYFGSSQTFLGTWPDQWNLLPNTTVTTGTTTLLIAGIANKRTYIFLAEGIAQGVNTTSFSQLVEAPTTTTPCDGTQIPITPATAANPGSNNGTAVYYGAVNVQSGTAVVAPNIIPRIIPAGDDVCVITTGTGSPVYSMKYFMGYAIHPN